MTDSEIEHLAGAMPLVSEPTALSSSAGNIESHDDALAAAKAQIANLNIALQTNRRIGMALGILMGRHGWTEEQAFAAMRVLSQYGHRKIRCRRRLKTDPGAPLGF